MTRFNGTLPVAPPITEVTHERTRLVDLIWYTSLITFHSLCVSNTSGFYCESCGEDNVAVFGGGRSADQFCSAATDQVGDGVDDDEDLRVGMYGVAIC